MLRHASILKLSKRMQNAAVALLFLFAYTVSMVGPFVPIAHAAVLPGSDVSVASFPFGIKNNSAYSEPSGTPTAVGSFKNGNVGAYVEGACIPTVFEVTNTSSSAGDIFLAAVFDHYNSPTVGIDNLEPITYSGTSNPVDIITNLNQLGYPKTNLSTATSFKNSSGSTTAASISGVYSGNSTGTAPFVYGSSTFGHYNMTLSNVAKNQTVYVAFCARLSLDASDYNGSSLSIRTAGAGAENIPIPVNSLLKRPSILVTKTVQTGTALPSDFSFTISPAVNGQSVFHIEAGANSVLIDNVYPDGAYTITESGPSGYSFTSGTGSACVVNNATLGTAAGAMTATVAAGKPASNAVCNFTNSINKGSIKIVKDATPNSSQSFGFTATGVNSTSFSLVDDGSNTQNSKTYSDLAPNQTYTFTETNATNWDLKSIVCTGAQSSTIDKTLPTASIMLAPGENITCTFSNDKQGTLVIEKQTLPDASTDTFGFTDSKNGTATLKDGETKSYQIVAGSTFSVSEDAKSGWKLTDLTCDNTAVTKDIAAGKVTFTPTAGAAAKCVYTNTKLGSIKISKDAIPNSADQFDFTATGTGVSNFNLDGDTDPVVPSSKTFTGLLPGDFIFVEQPKTSWDFDSISCSGATVTKVDATVTVHLAAGQDASCEYTNRMHGKLIVHKTTIPSGSQQTFAVSASSSDGGLLPGGSTGTVSDSQDATFNIQQNKHYSVSETVPEGWTETSNSCSNLSINGSSKLNNDGQPYVECTIVNTQKASVTIVKQANPEGKTAFGFTGDFNSFNLVDDGTTSNTKTFTNVLPNADYTVTESPTSGWYLSNLSCTGGSYKQGVSANSVIVTPKPGEHITCTFSNTKYGSISGTKYEANANGKTLSGLGGWTIFLDANGNGTFDDGEQNTTTDANGNFSFTDLKDGVYHVYEVLKDGWTQIFGGSNSTVNLAVGQNKTGVDFGNFKNVSISGHKWGDTNGDGKRQDSEPLLGGWTIQLKDANGTVLDSTATADITGDYSFNNLAPGTYTLCEVMQAGWVATSPSSGCQDVKAELSGVNKTDVDFGNFKKAGISGYKFNDHNGDGTKDSGDEKLSGWTIFLDANGNGKFDDGEQNTTTDGTGYSFTGLTPGTYKVCEVQQDNWVQTFPGGDGCRSFTVESGESYTANFGNQAQGSLTVVKDVDDGFGNVTKDVSTWKWSYDGIKQASNLSTGSTNVQKDIPAGTYDVEEDLASQANYHFTSVSCTGAGNDDVTNAAKTSVKVGVGENVVCTFTNTRDTANITVTKKVTNDNGGTAKVSDFELFVNQTKVTSGSTNSYLTDAEYTISENPLVDGYKQTSLKCWVAGPLETKVEIDVPFKLENGKDVHCEIVNDDIAPKLTVYKFVENYPTNLTKTPSDFSMQVSGTNVSEPSFPGNEDGTTVTLNEGTYSVGEIQDDQYDMYQYGDCDSSIKVGEEKYCYVYNVAIENPDIHVVKSGPTQAHEADVVKYTFTVTNPGNVPFPAVDVEDDIAGVGSYVSGDSNDNGYLDPGETWIYTANYTIPEGQEADVHNTVTVCGSYGYREESFVQSEGYKTVCDQDDHTLDVLHPGIHVVKDGPVNAQLGTVGTYTFTITNTGDTPLELTKVMDDIAGVGVYQSGDTNDNDLLDLDESWVFTANYQYTTVGTVTNTVDVCGVDELEAEVCSEDTHDTIVYVPQVLGEETLVDTGARPWTATVIAVALMMAGGLTLLLGRRNATYLSKK